MIQMTGKYVFVLSSLILFVLHLSLWIQDNHAFSVKKVVIEGTHILDSAHILSAIEVDTVNNIWNANIDNIKEELRKLPQIQDINVTRTFPSSLKIRVEERVPIALLIYNGLWGVDRNGFLLPRFRTEIGLDYPVIVGQKVNEYTTGKQVDNHTIIAIADFLSQLKGENPFVYSLISEVSMNKAMGIKIITVDNNVPIYLGKRDLIEKCSRIGATWHYLIKEKKLAAVSYLDARYEQQIILKHNKKEM